MDFYSFLGLTKENTPFPNSKENRVLLKELLNEKFMELAPKYHPDNGGDAEKFKFLLRAITVLGQENLRRKYDGLGTAGLDSSFVVDWEKYFTYNPESQAASFGDSHAKIISKLIKKDISFEPNLKEHGYNWVFDWKYENSPLTLSLVYNESDILALTDGQDAGQSLPFKVHLYIPTKRLKIGLDKKRAVKSEGTYLVVPGTTSIEFHDITLISTTNENKFSEFIKNLTTSLDNVGTDHFEEEIEDDQEIQSPKTESESKKLDKQALESIWKLKTHKLTPDEDGDKFLDKIQKKPIKRITSQVIVTKNKEG
jgi:curved DNA-binding protein CbpA